MAAAQTHEAAPWHAVGVGVMYVTTSPQVPSSLAPTDYAGTLQVLEHTAVLLRAFASAIHLLSLECFSHPFTWIVLTHSLGPAEMSLPQGCLL